MTGVQTCALPISLYFNIGDNINCYVRIKNNMVSKISYYKYGKKYFISCIALITCSIIFIISSYLFMAITMDKNEDYSCKYTFQYFNDICCKKRKNVFVKF